MPKNSSEPDTTASGTESKKHYGRKTGWCNNPSTKDPKVSHAKCDGIWCETKEGLTLHCPCDCHDLKSKKLENARRKKEQQQVKKKTTKKKAPKKKKPEPITSCKEHPKYGGIRRPRSGCKTCMKVYENKKS